MNDKLKTLIEDLRLNHEFCPKKVILQAADELERMGGHIETPLEAKDQPVAWGVFEGNLHDMFFTQEEAQEMADLKGSHAEVRPFYTAPPQPEQKPMHTQIQKMYEDYFDKCFRESSALDAAVQAEREACANVCDEMEKKAEEHGTECCKWPTPSDCAYAIRARG